MTREETASMLTILKTAYPSFYSKMKARDGELTLDLWATMFRDDPVEIVKFALYKLIEVHNGFPPDIADVKAKVREIITASTGEPTDEELWQVLKKAIEHGIYDAREEFEKLPPVLKRYCGSPSTLRDLASGDTDILNTVTHGQFMKQIGVLRDRQKFEDELPEAVREVTGRLYGRISDNDRYLSDTEINGRRNALCAVLDTDTGGRTK